MKWFTYAALTGLTLWCAASTLAAPATITVNASHVLNHVTPWMYGSCIEDVNHEIYGGLYAQKIFGESFEEPPTAPVAGWTAYAGAWSWQAGTYQVRANAGAKLVRDKSEIVDGTVECDVRFVDAQGGNAGLILRVSDAGTGADNWNGYEVSLSAHDNALVLGRHHHDWRLLQTVSAPVAAGQWHHLRVVMVGPTLSIFVDDGAKALLEYTDNPNPMLDGKVGLRTWNSDAAFRNLKITTAANIIDEQAEPPTGGSQVSGMWDAFSTGTAVAHYVHDAQNPYNSAYSQCLEHGAGSGSVGLANRGLNRWGIAVRRGHEYAGHLYLRQQNYAGRVTVALQSADGTRTYARQTLEAGSANWARQDFKLKPNATDADARFALWIDRPGTVWVDEVYLSGIGDELFHNLPYRVDISNMLVAEGLTFLRYAGTMVNVEGYRWKKMIGPPDLRPQYRGNWYPYATNGFGIEEFLRFCEAAHIEPAFAINTEETPQDAADLIEYLNGPVTSVWGHQRAVNGHPKPYGVRYIEIGNEETTNTHYLERFKLLEAAMHRQDTKLQLVIAAWWEPDNPVTKQIVQELNGKAALWDVHVNADDLNDGANVDQLFTRMQQLVRVWAPGTPLKACIFEENGGLHNLRRALSHARILNATERHGDFVLIDCPANCLQPWQQNDNGWDQGQVFFTPDHVWAMPSFYAQQMAALNHLPLRVASTVDNPNLDVTATRSEDGKTLVLKVVNINNTPRETTIALNDFDGMRPQTAIWTLSGNLDAVNPPVGPATVRSTQQTLQTAEQFGYTFPAYSYTVLRFSR